MNHTYKAILLLTLGIFFISAQLSGADLTEKQRSLLELKTKSLNDAIKNANDDFEILQAVASATKRSDTTTPEVLAFAESKFLNSHENSCDLHADLLSLGYQIPGYEFKQYARDFLRRCPVPRHPLDGLTYKSPQRSFSVKRVGPLSQENLDAYQSAVERRNIQRSLAEDMLANLEKLECSQANATGAIRQAEMQRQAARMQRQARPLQE